VELFFYLDKPDGTLIRGMEN